MSNKIAKQFEKGVNLHAKYLLALLAFSQASSEEDLAERRKQVEEIGAEVATLEFHTPQDVLFAMSTEAKDRLAKAQGVDNQKGLRDEEERFREDRGFPS